MSCKHDLLQNAASSHVSRSPSSRLEDLTREFHVSRRTLQNAIKMTTGKTFRELRNELLVERANSLLESHPARGIKELAFELGYKSSRSFARAIRRACGCSPSELRSRVMRRLLQAERRTFLRETQ